MQRLPVVVAASIVVTLLILLTVGVQGAPTVPLDLTPTAFMYLPAIQGLRNACPTLSGNQYDGGVAYQWDTDNPVRPAWNHADKNLELRSYSPVTPTHYSMVWYDVSNTHQPPQFATMFSPHRVPDFVGYYRVHD
jgi:hypothetical protein